jgi:hypothetical protein
MDNYLKGRRQVIKHYLLLHSRGLGTRSQVKACLNSLPAPAVISWRSEFPNSFFIKSELGADVLGQLIINCGEEKAPRFLLTEIPPHNDKSWGYLSSWPFLNRRNEEDR